MKAEGLPALGLLSRDLKPELPTLQQLIDPVPIATFLSEYWEKRPLYVARPLPQWCRELLSIDDLDALISHTSPPEGASQDDLVRLSDAYGVEYQSIERGPDGRPDMSAVYRAYAKGWSLAVYGLQRRWTPVAGLASRVASEIGQRMHVNLYLTPSGSRGLNAHADPHDVIVLQLEGRKSWRVFAPQYLLPLEAQVTVLKRDELGAAVLETTTEPGQILYLPRGFIHQAGRTEAPSMHLTIGFHPLRWLDLLEVGLRVVAERDVRFRRAVPSFEPGDESAADNTEREFASLLQAVQGRDVALEAMRRCLGAHIRTLRTSPDPHFNAIEQARSLSAGTEVIRRVGLRTRIIQADSRVHIEFGARSVSAPPSVASALEFVSAHERFRVDDLPGGLSPQSKIVLIRRLIQEGLLRIVTPAE